MFLDLRREIFTILLLHRSGNRMKYCHLLILALSLCSSACSPPKDIGYFIPIPFTKFSSIQAPCLDVELDGQTFSMELDLGFQGDLTLDCDLLEKIHSKTFISTRAMIGIQGKRYQTNLYKIPMAQIGSTNFIQPILQSNSQQFTKDSVFVQQGTPSFQEPGRIGWQLFQNTPLLVDVLSGKIAICDSLQTLKAKGFPIETFAKTELLMDHGLLEFMAVTETGPLRCTLDTGASRNVLGASTDQSMQQMLFEPENALSFSSFIIDRQDFGPIAFTRAPIKIPIPINAILGMQFFQNHLVFIDFWEKQIYFSQSAQRPIAERF
jgi:hypothetical protein